MKLFFSSTIKNYIIHPDESNLPAENTTLSALFHLKHSRIITLVGAGGKTSLLYALGRELSQTGNRTLLTTTTHIMEPTDLSEAVLVTSENSFQLRDAFSQSSLVALGIPAKKLDAGVKWRSPSLSFLKSVASLPDYILCEGDGSRRLPVKIPREGEPVFYPGTDMVIGVIGLSCLHQKAADCMFGLEEGLASFPSLANTFHGEEQRITTDTLMELASSPSGLFKNVENRNFHIVFNQADLLTEKERADFWKQTKRIRDKGINCHLVSLK
ncbi:MAG: selenium cofactor biosynthesis protein YqeC [Eubacteriales bacterium]|nr:selenium cofactor biosynthesis protein YqeC [Eubacteriales bacterium]